MAYINFYCSERLLNVQAVSCGEEVVISYMTMQAKQREIKKTVATYGLSNNAISNDFWVASKVTHNTANFYKYNFLLSMKQMTITVADGEDNFTHYGYKASFS